MNVLKLLADYEVPVDVVELILRFERVRVRERVRLITDWRRRLRAAEEAEAQGMSGYLNWQAMMGPGPFVGYTASVEQSLRDAAQWATQNRPYGPGF